MCMCVWGGVHVHTCVHGHVCDWLKKIERIREEGIPACLCLEGRGDKLSLWVVAGTRVSCRGKTGVKAGEEAGTSSWWPCVPGPS